MLLPLYTNYSFKTLFVYFFKFIYFSHTETSIRDLAKLGTVALASAPFGGAKAPLPTSFVRTLLKKRYLVPPPEKLGNSV